MNPTRVLQQSLFAAYGWVARSQLLELPWVADAVDRLYFVYKQRVEDSLGELMLQYPSLVAGGDVIDVGANVGYSATLFARYLTPGTRVWALEPEERNCQRLRGHARRLGLSDRIEILQTLVGAAAGNAELWVDPLNPAGHRTVTETARATFAGVADPTGGRSVQVPMISVDALVDQQKIERVSLIKIDVEGYEYEVCRGLEQTLARFPKAAVIAEFGPERMAQLGDLQAERYWLWLKQRRPHLYALEGEKLIPVRSYGETVAIAEQGLGYLDLLAAPAALGHL